MTREEILKRIKNNIKEGSEYSIFWDINGLFNDFESRVCENCIHCERVLSNTKNWCRNDNSPIGNINGLSLPDGFGCNKFERIDK